jgi:hypothetical protein
MAFFGLGIDAYAKRQKWQDFHQPAQAPIATSQEHERKREQKPFRSILRAMSQPLQTSRAPPCPRAGAKMPAMYVPYVGSISCQSGEALRRVFQRSGCQSRPLRCTSHQYAGAVFTSSSGRIESVPPAQPPNKHAPSIPQPRLRLQTRSEAFFQRGQADGTGGWRSRKRAGSRTPGLLATSKHGPIQED